MKRNRARATDRLVVLAATVCLAGNAYGVPSATFWTAIKRGHPYVPVIILVVVGTFGALGPFEGWSNRTSAGCWRYRTRSNHRWRRAISPSTSGRDSGHRRTRSRGF